jgi:chaperonin GroES
MKVKPIGDRILVKPRDKETKTKGGIFIPDSAQDEKVMEGTVLEIGDDKDVIKVKKGDDIIYDKYAGTTVKKDGEDLLLIKSDEVLAIVEK